MFSPDRPSGQIVIEEMCCARGEFVENHTGLSICECCKTVPRCTVQLIGTGRQVKCDWMSNERFSTDMARGRRQHVPAVGGATIQDMCLSVRTIFENERKGDLSQTQRQLSRSVSTSVQ